MKIFIALHCLKGRGEEGKENRLEIQKEKDNRRRREAYLVFTFPNGSMVPSTIFSLQRHGYAIRSSKRTKRITPWQETFFLDFFLNIF